MKGHCACQATGLSSHAIARRVEGCLSGGDHHPHDAGDLKRCVVYCEEMFVSTDDLRRSMTGVSPEWDALLPEWDSLVALMDEEHATGRAPRTYARMSELLSSPSPLSENAGRNDR